MFLKSSLPECSSLTSDDIVLVMESAAMSRSFLKFLLGPGDRHSLSSHATSHTFWYCMVITQTSVCLTDTLSEGLLNIPSHAHERVLRRVSRSRSSRVRADRRGDLPAGRVAGGRAWGAGTLSLQGMFQRSFKGKYSEARVGMTNLDFRVLS